MTLGQRDLALNPHSRKRAQHEQACEADTALLPRARIG